MQIEGATALVTGANRGLGRAFTQALLERGARTVYAAARRPESVLTAGVRALALDITDVESVAAAAEAAGDVTLLVNNAGITTYTNLMVGDLDAVRREMATNFFGPLLVTRAFAPVLARNGGGAVLNVLSALSWFSYDGATSYAASKAAAWSLTNATRVELAGQGTQVVGLALGAADTDMMAGYDGPMLAPADVVRAALDGVESGASEVLADDWTRRVKAALAGDPAEFYAEVARTGI